MAQTIWVSLWGVWHLPNLLLSTRELKDSTRLLVERRR
ncbi:MAG: hypothetical protein MjAS7_2401 [Metallosphaera javensis (ex Sakai et al. 2022)]|nr:MAG: hypothetical protein MjAS7_2401 [Metallosphaera javensis (ex Sakai et al. 2022)]